MGNAALLCSVAALVLIPNLLRVSAAPEPAEASLFRKRLPHTYHSSTAVQHKDLQFKHAKAKDEMVVLVRLKDNTKVHKSDADEQHSAAAWPRPTIPAHSGLYGAHSRLGADDVRPGQNPDEAAFPSGIAPSFTTPGKPEQHPGQADLLHHQRQLDFQHLALLQHSRHEVQQPLGHVQHQQQRPSPLPEQPTQQRVPVHELQQPLQQQGDMAASLQQLSDRVMQMHQGYQKFHAELLTLEETINQLSSQLPGLTQICAAKALPADSAAAVGRGAASLVEHVKQQHARMQQQRQALADAVTHVGNILQQAGVGLVGGRDDSGQQHQHVFHQLQQVPDSQSRLLSEPRAQALTEPGRGLRDPAAHAGANHQDADTERLDGELRELPGSVQQLTGKVGRGGQKDHRSAAVGQSKEEPPNRPDKAGIKALLPVAKQLRAQGKNVRWQRDTLQVLLKTGDDKPRWVQVAA